MRIVTRTVYGSAMQSAQFLGLPYIVQPSSTLNEKFGIQANAIPGGDERHAARFFVIGNRGHRNVTGADGIGYTDPVNHAATDASVFGPVPFVLREVANDLPVERRNQYALRKIEQHNGQTYVAYYAKELNLTGATINLQRTVIEDGNRITTPFVPSNQNLNPQPLSTTEGEGNVITASGEYVSASTVVTINFTELDAEEYRNVARILYGDEKYAVISEIAFVGAVSRIVTGEGMGNNTIDYREIIAAQIVSFVSTYYHLVLQNNGFSFTADVGVSEPLFAIQEENP